MEALKSEIESIKLQIQRLCSFAETNLQKSTPSSSSTETDVTSSAIQQVLEVLNRIDNKLNELTTTSSTSSTSLPSIPYSTNTTGPHPIPNLDKIGHHTLKPLTKDDLGPNLIAKLAELETNTHFSGKVRVAIEDLGIDWRDFARRARPLPDHKQFAVQHCQGNDGFSNLYLGHLKKMPAIDLNQSDKEPTHDEAFNFAHDTIESPPVGERSYFVGEFDKSGTPLAELFSSGALSILGELPGINTLYMHMGESGSGTAFHCEDAELHSYNLNIIGYKLWIMIAPDNTSKFEEMLDDQFGLQKCDQGVRHLNIMVSPKKLLEKGIKFDIICAGPGDLVITRPRQYHAVLNYTPSLAIATNYTLPNEQPIPPGCGVCPRDGLYRLSHTNLRKLSNQPKRKAGATALLYSPPTKKTKTHPTALPNRKRQNTHHSKVAINKQRDKRHNEENRDGHTQQQGQQQEPHELTGHEDDNEGSDEEDDDDGDKEDDDDGDENNNGSNNGNSDGESNQQQGTINGRRLASLTTNRDAILRFMSIVQAWDNADVGLKRLFAGGKPKDELTSATHYDGLQQKSQNFGVLYTVLGMSASFRLSKVMIDDQQRHRTSSHCMSAVLAGRGIDDNKRTRKKLSTELSEARKIMKMVEGYDGLLCFLPLGSDSGFTLRDLKRGSNEQIQAFRTTVARYENLMLLNEVGNEFLLSIWGEGEFKERCFQSKQPHELRTLPDGDLITLLR
ncbi:JmjC domain, hydroxylase-domain-containing protein [Pseudoneurospora amorphoporcata]|uniref:JmjC domain, hydroxylase-domain-containing protein n=1 Tax=Pseudoneurospora amorphoporcata TaxID=241081 RepID=A0AAN6NMK8_9PEZI|nr:JmjC domain, hydroxylase-domain-containing protein [Pseudoneurospora amorphoporcata]